MKRDADYFGDEELDLVFIARRLRDATSLEAVFTAAGIDYAVQPEEYVGGLIFKTKRIGAFFYVRPVHQEQTVAVMLAKGYIPLKE